jgi:hypothetical protein
MLSDIFGMTSGGFLAAVRRRNPAGYYFAASVGADTAEVVDGVVVFMTDADYFDRTSNQSDWHISEVTSVPDWIGEEAEGVFTSERTLAETVQELTRLGFRQSIAFSRMMGCPLVPDQVLPPQPVRRPHGHPQTPGRPWYERLDDD